MFPATESLWIMKGLCFGMLLLDVESAVWIIYGV